MLHFLSLSFCTLKYISRQIMHKFVLSEEDFVFQTRYNILRYFDFMWMFISHQNVFRTSKSCSVSAYIFNASYHLCTLLSLVKGKWYGLWGNILGSHNRWPLNISHLLVTANISIPKSAFYIKSLYNGQLQFLCLRKMNDAESLHCEPPKWFVFFFYGRVFFPFSILF